MILETGSPRTWHWCLLSLSLFPNIGGHQRGEEAEVIYKQSTLMRTVDVNPNLLVG